MAEYKEFVIGELFDIQKGKRLTKEDQTNGCTPFIGSTATNNGITGYIGQSPIFDKNAITVSYNGSVGQVFYQEKNFWASDDINVLRLKDRDLNPLIFGYIGTALSKTGKSFAYNFKWNVERMRTSKILLPVTSAGEPDWEYMEAYIRELEQERIRELELYLTATGLNNYKLTNADIDVLSEEKKIGEFKVPDIFDIANTHCVLSSQIILGGSKYPYLTAQAGNNSVVGYSDMEVPNLIDKGDCIFIGGKTLVFSYQEKDFYSNDSHNLVLRTKVITSKETKLFILSALEKSLSVRYSWNDSVSYKKIQTDIISLPTAPSGEPDYDYMERYIKAIQKTVIADVVKWKDDIISTTKDIVNK